MTRQSQRDPYSRVYDVEDDDFGGGYRDEDFFEHDEFGFEAFGCCIPEQCCMPGPHFPSECVSSEMMENLFAEAELEAEAAGELDPTGWPTPDPEEGPF